jgi:hypothetical protein
MGREILVGPVDPRLVAARCRDPSLQIVADKCLRHPFVWYVAMLPTRRFSAAYRGTSAIEPARDLNIGAHAD